MKTYSHVGHTPSCRRVLGGGRTLGAFVVGGVAYVTSHQSLEARGVFQHLHTSLRGAIAQGAAFVGGGEAAIRSMFFGNGQQQAIRGGGSRPSRNTRRQSTSEDGVLSASQGLLAINIVMYGLQVWTKDSITLAVAKVNQLIMAGQYWRLLTPAFFHGNLMHLAVNCYSLYNIAPPLERLGGSPRLVVTYIIAAIAGNVASFYGSPAPSLGASGAVFGLGGALAMYFYQNKSLYGKKSDYVLKQLWQTLLINMMYGFANPRIDNYGHLGGLIGGAVAAYLLGPTLKIVETDGGSRRYLADVPPIGIFASKPIRLA
jgi:membrane associated rhomboid family serine protease